MKILFVYDRKMSSFIRNDLDILRKRHEVKVVRFSTVLDAPRIWKGTCWCDLTFSWFASVHAFFSVLFSRMLAKKSVVVAGGYDVARIPELKYGLSSFWWKRWLPRFIFRFVDRVLTVSRSNTQDALRNTKADPQKVRLVYLGFDPCICHSHLDKTRENKALCVSSINETNLVLKGLNLLVATGKLLPDTEFVIAGEWIDSSIRGLETKASPNLKFLGRVDQSRLFRMMSETKVYVQVSRHESFGCALAEAMLCGCVPVVSRGAALPEVVGKCGFYLTSRSPEELALLIKRALDTDDKLGKQARRRIKTLFPLKKREDSLYQILEQLAG